MSPRALVLEAFDATPRLVEAPPPPVRPDEVLIRVRAASLNAFDWKVAAGTLASLFRYRFPVTIGRDYAGTVVEAGPEVTRVAPGDAVFGYLNAAELHRGSLADYLVCGQDECFVTKPEELSFETAACLPLAGIVARRCVDAVAAGPGARVLVIGAPGGVGSFALQLAARAGAHVIASARADDRDYVVELGAAETVEPGGGLLEAVRARHPDGLQGLIDLVSYRAEFLEHVGLLAPGGRAASTHRAVDDEILHAQSLTGVNVSSAPDRDLLEALGLAAADGRLAVPLQRVYPLERAAEGLVRLREEHSRGKVSVRMNGRPG